VGNTAQTTGLTNRGSSGTKKQRGTITCIDGLSAGTKTISGSSRIAKGACCRRHRAVPSPAEPGATAQHVTPPDDRGKRRRQQRREEPVKVALAEAIQHGEIVGGKPPDRAIITPCTA
jgi:hypothetical protein